MKWMKKVVRERQRFVAYDEMLIWLTLILMCIGLVMVYSSSAVIGAAGANYSHNEFFFAQRQAVFSVIAIAAGLFAFQFPMSFWQKNAKWLMLGALFLLFLVLMPKIGVVVKGSRRWINLIYFNLQPSELAKVTTILFLAYFATLRQAFLADFKTCIKNIIGPILLFLAITSGLLLAEPDFGAFAVILCISLGILFLAGINARLFFGSLFFVALSVAIMIGSSEYRMRRFTSFLNPWDDPQRSDYQLIQALLAINKGGWWGTGLGDSVLKQFYLPEPHTDFILSVIAEEFGFVGVSTVMLLIALLVLRAFKIGREATRVERYFSSLVAYGVGIWIGVQSLINIGVNFGALPTKGLTLPLLSFGGSGLLANLIAIAILLRVDYENRQLKRGVQTQ